MEITDSSNQWCPFLYKKIDNHTTVQKLKKKTKNKNPPGFNDDVVQKHGEVMSAEPTIYILYYIYIHSITNVF